MKKLSCFIIILQLYSNALFAQVGINAENSTPDPSAMLDVKSTTKGALLPRMTIAQRNNIVSPAEGLMLFCTNCGASGGGELSIFTNGSWFTLLKQGQWSCGEPFTINHKTGVVAPVNKTVIYWAVTNIPGEPTKCWISQNLGADHQATVKNDATEASAGWYWQFNRKRGYRHDGVTLTPAWTVGNITENSNWVAANDPCTIELGSVWRVPTYTEWYNVDDAGGWMNLDGPWESALKLHGAGSLNNNNGSLGGRGSYGYFWCSNQQTINDGWTLTIYDAHSYMFPYSKAYGFSVRCIRE